jgi:hypothetical protein
MEAIDERHRVVTVLTEDEKDALQRLAWRSGRSMAGYLRYLLNVDVGENEEYLSDS